MLVNFTLLPMRAVIAHLPQFRVRSDDVLRARKLLCEWAAEHGCLDLLKWAHERDYPLLQVRNGRRACKAAARGGHLAVLQWLCQIKCLWTKSTCEKAAEGGHLEVLQWAHEHGCKWSSRAMLFAATRGGHVRVLQWLRAHGCEWQSDVVYWSARHGHVDALEWAIQNGCGIPPDAGAAALCFAAGDPRMLQWALKRTMSGFERYYDAPGLTLEVLRTLKEQRLDLASDMQPYFSTLATRNLARVGDLAGLEWARANGFFDCLAVYVGAARGGQLAVLQWAKRNLYYAGDLGVWNTMAKYGHLECLKWAAASGSSNGSSLSRESCAKAAAGGNLSVLQWLREEMNCEWDADTLAQALHAGHWEVFEWARQHGCPVNERVIEAAAIRGYADVLQWAFKNAAGSIELAQNWCSAVYNVECLAVLRAHACPWREQTCAVFAQRGELELIQWARANGCPWDRDTCSRAVTEDNLYLLQWAIQAGCPFAYEDDREWWSNYDLKAEFARLSVPNVK